MNWINKEHYELLRITNQQVLNLRYNLQELRRLLIQNLISNTDYHKLENMLLSTDKNIYNLAIEIIKTK